MLDPSAYKDGFARDNLPQEDLWPAMKALSDMKYPAATQLRCRAARRDD